MLRICNLSSGSEGNCTYVESEGVKLLVDDGLSCLETCKRLEGLGVKPNEIDAVVVTHEHNDHVKGIDRFSKITNCKVISNVNVYRGLDYKLKHVSMNNRIVTYDFPFKFKGIEFTPVALPHDVPCYGYVLCKDGQKISILTDLGHTSSEILESVKGSTLVYLESNYDENMLLKGTKYSYSLKQRILGQRGHLSNICSANFIKDLVINGTRQVVLSHLSKENNSPSLAYNTAKDRLNQFGIIEGKNVCIDVATTSPGTIFKLR